MRPFALRTRSAWITSAILAVASLSLPASAQEDTGAATPTFKEGDVIGIDKIDSLKPFLPEEFWSNRDFFFYEGMKLEVGPFFRDYSPSDAYKAASRSSPARPRWGPPRASRTSRRARPSRWTRSTARATRRRARRSSGTSTTSGKGTARAPATTTPTGTAARSSRSTTRDGEDHPALHRVEPEYLDDPALKGDMFRGERRKNAFGIEVDAPFDARGILVMTYRYKESDRPTAQTKNDDTWVYVPTLRRVRRISSAQRTDAVSGTDFTFDDLRSFSGIVPQYKWQCLGEMDLLAPMNSKVAAYPYKKDHNFGPYGLSYADDRWELRHAVKVRFVPNNSDHPYHHKDIYIDKQSMTPLYSFAYEPQGRAVEDHLAQPPLERRQPARGQETLVRRLGGRAAGARPARDQRHDRERADGHRQPDRVLGLERDAAPEQGQGAALHRRGPPHEGPLAPCRGSGRATRASEPRDATLAQGAVRRERF